MEVLLRKETRKPYVLSLLRSILKLANYQQDPIVKNYLKTTAVFAFKK